MARFDDLTLAEVLADPMILAVARADGWSKENFKQEMIWASQELRRPKIGKNIAFSPTVAKTAVQPCCAY